MSRIQVVLLYLLVLASCSRSTAPFAVTGLGVPPPGLYRCWAGGFAHLPAGTFTLASNGRYESYRSGGGGRYAFSPSAAAIDFLDGDYYYWEYRGIFQPAPQSLAVRSTALHSNDRQDRIVLMPLGAIDAIGSERPGEYQYCYLDTSRG